MAYSEVMVEDRTNEEEQEKRVRSLQKRLNRGHMWSARRLLQRKERLLALYLLEIVAGEQDLALETQSPFSLSRAAMRRFMERKIRAG